MSDVDVLIVGAGFAGLAAARAAAEAGAKTLVVEAKPQVGVRLHTTGIFVKEADDAVGLPGELTRRVEAVRLYGPSRKTVDLTADDYFFLTTDTGGVLRWMGEAARAAGAQIRTGARLTAAAREGDHVVVTAGGETIRARWLLGMDGARSKVAELFGLGRNARFLVGAEREYAHAHDLDERYLHCFLDSHTAPGYIAWAAPAPGFIQVGLAVSKNRKPAIVPFTREAERRFAMPHDAVVERRAGLIPCGGLVEPWAGDRVTLVGDAAGMVSPLTGGGIKLALVFGKRAGEAAAAHLLHGAPPPEEVLKPLLPSFFVKGVLRGLLDQAPANRLLDLAIATPLFRAFARRVYF